MLLLHEQRSVVLFTFAKNRYRFGNVEFNNRSRFVEELDRKHIEFDDNSNALAH